MARQKNYRERVKGDRTFNNSWYASDVISYSSDVVSISPDESLIYNYLRFSPASPKKGDEATQRNGATRKNKRRSIEGDVVVGGDGDGDVGGGGGESSSGNCSLCALDEKRVNVQVQFITDIGNPVGRTGRFLSFFLERFFFGQRTRLCAL